MASSTAWGGRRPDSAGVGRIRTPAVPCRVSVPAGTSRGFRCRAERAARHVRGMACLTVRDAAIIGLAQAAALIPGVSRSGATITAGLFRDMTRADAARFSFLLGVPIVALAGAKGLLDLLTSGLGAGQLGVFAVGVAVSALAGFAAIWGLLRYLQRASTAVFIVYRIVLGIVLIALVVIR